MNYTEAQQDLLRRLPKVDELMGRVSSGPAPHLLVLRACRETIAAMREMIMSGPAPSPGLVDLERAVSLTQERIESLMRPSLRPVVNGTGVIIHTNLGRSLLPPEILPDLVAAAGRYTNLEYNLARGERGSRYSHVEDILCELTGAEAALVVNNNAAAVLITLETLAKGREVIVSRGELVEIGGSFRIPDVMTRSGAILREVGATNRTHFRDYEGAINEETALLLKVHKSNFYMVGFTKEVSVSELSELGRKRGLPVYVDLGSGTLVDFAAYGLQHEPTVQEEMRAGADVLSFSGDKLLGGPQAGIIVGRRVLVDAIKKNPLNRALRIDKLTLSALESILRLYRDEREAVRTVPTLRMMTEDPEGIRGRAVALRAALSALSLGGLAVSVQKTESRVGGGALPFQVLPSFGVRVEISPGLGSSAAFERLLRGHEPPVIARIEEDAILFDARTIQTDDMPTIAKAVSSACHFLREGRSA